jgi:hydrogenase maturation protease
VNLAHVDQIAKAVLYEGYMLYPYRPSSVKNQQRWNFGILHPEAYSEVQGGDEACSMRTECLICGSPNTTFEVKLRFLHLLTRFKGKSVTNSTQSLPNAWQEAVEGDVSLTAMSLEQLAREPLRQPFLIPADTRVENERESGGEASIASSQSQVEGEIEVKAETVQADVFKVSIVLRNTTPLGTSASRDEALMHSLVSTHLILGVDGGDFVSLLSPPLALQEQAALCQNVGAWPVLVGQDGQRDTMLASPIILYDYPQIAPESAGDLFDGTEIDEILSLRIMTLTDDEKREIRESDERVSQILERTENMPAEQFMKLHGALRGLRPLKETAR